jgi:N-acetylglucosaminyl-diphospho-decaprenol L-rhamnosyltransferase
MTVDLACAATGVKQLSSPDALASIPIMIVGFRNPTDIDRCLSALSRMGQTPLFEVFICENGGPEAYEELVSTLIRTTGSCSGGAAPVSDVVEASSIRQNFVRTVRLRLRTSEADTAVVVHVGEAPANLGFAGGVNAWLRPLLEQSGWPGIWVLNPDTEPAPGALNELVLYADLHDRDMVGSRLVARHAPDVVQARGLAWRKWRGATMLVDLHVPITISPSPDGVDRRLDAPSGASMYVTRDCLTRIGLMDEQYFLYFEDLDWGMRAKRQGKIGYADHSVVMHDGGTTIGSAMTRRQQSPLATYLNFRNRLLFVRSHGTRWLVWTILIELAEILDLARLFAFRNMQVATRGMIAGLIGRSGRPDHIIRAHRAPVRSSA